MTKEILNKYVKIDVKILSDPNFYNKYNQVLNDIANRISTVLNTISDFIKNILGIATIITLMMRINGYMILISLFGVIVSIFLTPLQNKLGFKAYQERTIEERKQGYVKRIFYIFEYIKELKISSSIPMFFKKYEKSNEELVGVTKKYSIKIIALGIFSGFLNIIAFSMILFYLAYIALFQGGYTYGQIAALYNASMELKGNLLSLFSIIPRFDENSRYIENYKIFSEIKSVIEDNGNKVELEHFDKLTFENVFFKYKDDSESYILKNITFSLNNKEKVALVGVNGAGKSTIVNLCLRLFDPNQGEVFYNDKNYKDINVDNLRNKFSVILQDCKYYAFTIAENILLREPTSEEDELKVWESLKMVGLYDDIKNLKNGIYTSISNEFNTDGVFLSGGQLQKMMAARIFVSDSPILILDEITSNMDSYSENNLYNNIIEYVEKNNKSIIFITHKMSTTKLADKILVIDKGEIIEEGNHIQLMKKNGKYTELFNYQAEKYYVDI
ncbi:MAG: ABC transporter ATP-binding protein [Bacilli bacterium]|nr:ABC transporter ATP-binding protein [Bacilli bacterium]